jgi:hypothetical protein
LSRVQKLFSAARATSCCTVIHRYLSQLQVEMHKFQQTNTFEAFRLFNELKFYMALDSYESLEPLLKESFEQLRAKAPSCLRLLLWPQEDEKQLKLINKFFDSTLCVQNEKIICCSQDESEELLCSVAVDSGKVLTRLSFEAADAPLTLDAFTLGAMGRVALGATRWRLKIVDGHYVKIYTDDGKT